MSLTRSMVGILANDDHFDLVNWCVMSPGPHLLLWWINCAL